MLQTQITDSDLVPYPHYFLFYYISRHEYGPDWYSWSLINFKNDKRNDVAAWSDYATLALRDLKLDNNTILIRALHSHETVVSPDVDIPLDRLCRAISATYHCDYLPGLIYKTRRTEPLHTLKSVNNRVSELSGVYRVDTSINLKGKSILLIDDLLTSSLTAKNIINAVKAVFPEVKLSLFTLAKTGFNPDINKSIDLKGSIYRFNGIMWVML